MAQLFFKRGLKDINRVAVRSTANTSLVLLKILLREKYASDPEYSVSDAGMDEMLTQADAALITGCEAINLSQLYQNRLDLGEEWYDLTGLPFVFSILAGRKFVMGRNEIAPILKSFELGKKNLEKIARQFAGKDNVPWTPYHDFISRQINYRFSELDQDGLNEFYNYAFFFGYIDQIPDINLIN
jgi:chorismate dehydratase